MVQICLQLLAHPARARLLVLRVLLKGAARNLYNNSRKLPGQACSKAELLQSKKGLASRTRYNSNSDLGKCCFSLCMRLYVYLQILSKYAWVCQHVVGSQYKTKGRQGTTAALSLQNLVLELQMDVSIRIESLENPIFLLQFRLKALLRLRACPSLRLLKHAWLGPLHHRMAIRLLLAVRLVDCSNAYLPHVYSSPWHQMHFPAMMSSQHACPK